MSSVVLEQPREQRERVFADALIAMGKERSNIVVMAADLAKSCECDVFGTNFPDRYYNLGMAEQSIIGTAAGLAREGDIVFVHSFAVFLTRRCYDQVTVSVGYPGLNVKLIGFMPGLSTPGGVTHQAIDDIAMMRAMPGMMVVDPVDAVEHAQLPAILADHAGPAYVRARRGRVPVIFDERRYQLVPGAAHVLRTGGDVTLVASGLMTEIALDASAALAEQGIKATLIHCPTIKPFDTETILAHADRTGTVIALDNHNIYGGLGSAVAEALAEGGVGCRFIRFGLKDTYAGSGSPDWLFEQWGLDAAALVNTVVREVRGTAVVKADARSSNQHEAGWAEEM